MTRRILQLFVGLLCYGLGLALMLRAQVGVAPWDVLSQGISLHLPLSFGAITIIVAGLVLLLWIPIREKPGFGTIANALLIGAFADLFLWMLPLQTELPWQLLTFALGLVTVGFATGLYIGARMGSGPRDGLMTGLHRVTGKPIWMVRTGIEIVVLAGGWLLGGNVGLGTVAFALLVGPIAGFFMPLLHVKLPGDDTAPPPDPAEEPSPTTGPVFTGR